MSVLGTNTGAWRDGKQSDAVDGCCVQSVISSSVETATKSLHGAAVLC
jgi:hypothetical protein